MNSEQMCIDDSKHRPPVIRLLEAVMTGIVWLAYVGLLPYIWSAFSERGAQTGALSRSFQWTAAEAHGLGFGSFVMQLLAVALCGSSLLYLWACYNRLRFQNKDRRKVPVTVTATELAAYYGGSCSISIRGIAGKFASFAVPASSVRPMVMPAAA
jgi:poly-beta-1,6-N-acetyl-D-glucosamine biosynthesis protein PgaD